MHMSKIEVCSLLLLELHISYWCIGFENSNIALLLIIIEFKSYKILHNV